MTQRASARPVELLTIPVAAKHLGCSEMHVYRLVAAGELSAVDIAAPTSSRTKTRIRSDDLTEYINRRTRRTPTSAR